MWPHEKKEHTEGMESARVQIPTVLPSAQFLCPEQPDIMTHLISSTRPQGWGHVLNEDCDQNPLPIL